MPAVQLLEERISLASPSSVEQSWRIDDAPEHTDARDAIYAELASWIAIDSGHTLWLPLAEVSLERLNARAWSSGVKYAGPVAGPTDGSPPTPETTFEVEYTTIGGTRHISHSLAFSVSTYKPEFFLSSGAISPDREGEPRGIDVPDAEFSWSETHVKPPDWLSVSRADKITRLTNTVNAETFRGLPAGEVRFHGLERGSRVGTGPNRLTFRFSRAVEAHAVYNVGTPEEFEVTKPAHWYLDLHNEDIVDDSGNKTGTRPKAAVVHQVFPPDDFGDLDIGS